MYKGRPVAAIIAAGGAGTRFGGDVPKQFRDVGGKPMWARAAAAFAEHEAVDEVVVVVPESGAGFENNGNDVCFVSGGADRQASVRNGLAAVSFADGLALIHDAARPFVSREVIDRVIEGAASCGAAVPGVPVTDTIYQGETALDREALRAVQTPQGFDLCLIRAAHARAAEAGASYTDDGSLVLAAGHAVRVVEGDAANVKVTTPTDMESATCSAIGGRQDAAPTAGIDGGANRAGIGAGASRVGIGFDAHRFVGGRPLILGGVEIPFEMGLQGHSDADVLTHAFMDAILGALRLGDIGTLFPDSDPAYAGVSSMKLLADVTRRMRGAGYEIENADGVVVCEQPKLAPHRAEIEKRLADALGVPSGRVSVKGTTTERLGFTGREEGIAAEAVVLLKKKAWV
ncbi:MAG: 2-C-methyl-D-erythritol 4-phosphate cytidylyltransferase [Clostridiales Family XIII bacterium]|jgi:2-C-methyl-D-erythritol 4-phosphate cytidylyltransferase/2-C-methyl-D-erythritol 2,4-cyclodiphosphate synthase|nr:2-C-methyl-D-erythritol 4-phosphate cytidylyltransferase [Clostridiales Family XIII bacterium]